MKCFLKKNISPLFAVAIVIALPVDRTFAAEASLSADASKVEERPAYSFGAEYMASSDFAEQLKPRLVRHDMSAYFGYDFRDIVSASVGTNYFFKTVGGSYSKFREDSGISSVSPRLTRAIFPNLEFLGGKHSISAMASGDIPFDEDSRIDGYKGAVVFGPSMVSRYFGDILRIRSRLSYGFIFNRYRFSPTSFDATAKNNYGANFSTSVKIIAGLRAGIGVGARRTIYSDGFDEFSFNNTQSLSYSWSSITATLMHTNGGYTDDGRAQLWYVDRYRRIFSGSLAYDF
jgi:hypothetical protein